MSTRKINRVMKGKPTIEGAGVNLKRVFAHEHAPQFDPFLLFDDFQSKNPEDYIKGFPWHPHRGIETITYVLTGEVEHGDSMGNEGVISSGEVQWMTAGSGVIHQEMPRISGDGTLCGFQLWANLPASHKMIPPRYRGIQQDEIPLVQGKNGVDIRIICGKVNGVQGPVTDVVIDPEYLDVMIPANTDFKYPVKSGHTVMAYVLTGKGFFDPNRDPYSYEIEGENYFDLEREAMIGPQTMVVYDDGEQLHITSGNDGIRFLLMSGKPIGEPVAWQGPIVMNTKEELRTAFEDLKRGTFIRDNE